MAFALRVRIREFKIAPGDFVFACTKKVTKEMHPGRVGPQKSMGASLAAMILLQGRMDAPSGLIHAKTHIPVRFTLAKSPLRGNA